MRGDVQEVQIRVKGGYSPDRIRVRKGVPLRLLFDRQESGDCRERVVFPDFRVSKQLPAFQRTVVELVPERSGRFPFAGRTGLSASWPQVCLAGPPQPSSASHS